MGAEVEPVGLHRPLRRTDPGEYRDAVAERNGTLERARNHCDAHSRRRLVRGEPKGDKVGQFHPFAVSAGAGNLGDRALDGRFKPLGRNRRGDHVCAQRRRGEARGGERGGHHEAGSQPSQRRERSGAPCPR